MGPPTILARIRQTLGRACRETGQAIDRLGIQTEQLILSDRHFGDDPFKYDVPLSRHRNIFPLLPYGEPLLSPQIAYIAPCSTLIGSVRVGHQASIFYGAILRADHCDNGSSFTTNTTTTTTNTTTTTHDDDNDYASSYNMTSSAIDSIQYSFNHDTATTTTTTTKNTISLQKQEEEDKDDDNDNDNNTCNIVNDHNHNNNNNNNKFDRMMIEYEEKSAPFELDPYRLENPGQPMSYENNNQKNHNEILPTTPPNELVGGGIYIGNHSTIQDGCIITAKYNHTIVREEVFVDLKAQIHSAHIHKHCYIGMASIIKEFVVLPEETYIAPGSVVLAQHTNTRIQPGELWAGNPATKIRNLTTEERTKLKSKAHKYVKIAVGQQKVMTIGGNFPDTEERLLSLGQPHSEDNDEEKNNNNHNNLNLLSATGLTNNNNKNNNNNASAYIQRRKHTMWVADENKKKQRQQQRRQMRIKKRRMQ